MNMRDAPAFGGLAQDHRFGRYAIDGLVLVLSGRATFADDTGGIAIDKAIAPRKS